jgi:hypothetical protein
MLKWLCGIADAVTALAEQSQSSPPPGVGPLWGDSSVSRPTATHSGGTGAAAGIGSLEPTSQRLLRLAGILSLLLILVVVNSLLSSGNESPFSPNPVAAAAERTRETPGMRFTLEMRLSINGSPTATIRGHGTYSGEDHAAVVSYDATSAAGTEMPFDAILSESGWYFRYPQYLSKMPAGKEWLKVEGLPGQSDESKMSESPESTLRVLSAAGAVRAAGRLRVRGVPTRRYQATITAAGMTSALRAQGKDELADMFEGVTLAEPVHVEVCIDGKGMLRRIRTLTTVLAEGKAVTTTVVTDLFDFGIHPSIEAPDASEVYDLTPALEEKLGEVGSPS